MTILDLNTKTVGLFGTCGGSKWRDPFMDMFTELGIPFYNPQVANWTPDCAPTEAWHLANDTMILFPVTAETYGFGSLGETGFSILSTLRTNKHRMVIMFIAPQVSAALQAADSERALESMRARKLIIAHLQEQQMSNVFIAHSMQDMLHKAAKLYKAALLLDEVRDEHVCGWRAALSPDQWRVIIDDHSVEPVKGVTA